MESHIQVGIFQNVDRLVGLNFVKMDVAHADGDTALVLTALGVVIGRRVVIHGLTAIGLVGTSRSVWVGQTNRIRSRDAGQCEVA